MSELDYKKEALTPKWWLILNALGHTFIGTLLPLAPADRAPNQPS